MASRMKSKVVAILETRSGAHLAELVARRGGVPLLAPALEEVPDIDPQAVRALLVQWRERPFNICIFQTGVGTRALFLATDAANLSGELQDLLAASTVVVRGPKPVGELNARGVRIDIRAASPFTTEMVLAALADVPVAEAASMPWSLPVRFKSITSIRWPRRPEVRRIWRIISIARWSPR
jgi:uroporphyrinogen-III synthase